MTVTPEAPAALSPSLEEQVRYLYDRSRISDVLCRYAYSCDTKDVAALHTLFTQDARARYGRTQEWLHGGPSIADWIGTAVAPTEWGHHHISVYDVQVKGERATALVYLISHQSSAEDHDQVLMMTSRYSIELARDGASWRIAVLDLLVGWHETRTASQVGLP